MDSAFPGTEKRRSVFAGDLTTQLAISKGITKARGPWEKKCPICSDCYSENSFPDHFENCKPRTEPSRKSLSQLRKESEKKIAALRLSNSLVNQSKKTKRGSQENKRRKKKTIKNV